MIKLFSSINTSFASNGDKIIIPTKAKIHKEEQDILYKGIDVYVNSTYYQLPYNETQTIEDVYKYLKTTDKFKGAEDVLEGGKIWIIHN